MTKFLAAAAALCLVAGCGDNLPGGDIDDLVGIYHLRASSEGYDFPVVFRLDMDGDQLAGEAEGSPFKRLTCDASATTVDAELGGLDEDETGTMHVVFGADGPTGKVKRCRGENCFEADITGGGKLTRLDEADARGITLLGEYAGPTAARWSDISVNVRVADGIAYLANYRDGLRIVDVHDPAALRELGQVPVEFPDDREIYNDVKIVDGPQQRRYAIMASNKVGAVAVDVTDPMRPAIASHFGTAAEDRPGVKVHTLFIDGGKAYLANISRSGLEIYDIADPAAPVRLGEWVNPRVSQDGGFVHDLYVSGPRAYLAYWDLGMSIVDVADPAAGRLVGEFKDYGETSSHSAWVTRIGDRSIAVHGDEQWNAHVHIVDVTEGTAAFGNAIGEWQTRPEVSVHNIMAFGDLAIMSHYQDGVRVLRLTDPSHPELVAWYNTWPGYDRRYGESFFEGAVGIDFDPDNRTLYVADTHRGLLVLRLDP